MKSDTKNIIRRLTVKRVWNLIKIYLSFFLSRWTKKPILWGKPFSIAIEPTTACNLRCPECPSGLRSFSRDTGNLKSDFFRQMIDQLHKEAFYLTFYFQGEPYINPDFLSMVKYAHDKKIYTATSTNGHFLNDKNAKATIESGLDRIIISIDGTTQETYEAYRKNGKLENVLQGTRNLIKWKRELKSTTPHIIFQFLVVAPNEHQIPEVYELAKQLGVDEVKLKTAQIYDYEQGNYLIPKNPRYSRYQQQKDGSYKIKNRWLNHCWKLWHSCVITWDGWVVPCCFDKDAEYKMGDLKNLDFASVWQSADYKKFRTQILQGRDKIDICRNCTEGCEVWTKPE